VAVFTKDAGGDITRAVRTLDGISIKSSSRSVSSGRTRLSARLTDLRTHRRVAAGRIQLWERVGGSWQRVSNVRIHRGTAVVTVSTSGRSYQWRYAGTPNKRTAALSRTRTI
jgi:hypothetical protein